MSDWKAYKERYGSEVVAARVLDRNEHWSSENTTYVHGDYEIVFSRCKEALAMKKEPFEILYTLKCECGLCTCSSGACELHDADECVDGQGMTEKQVYDKSIPYTDQGKAMVREVHDEIKQSGIVTYKGSVVESADGEVMDVLSDSYQTRRVR